MEFTKLIMLMFLLHILADFNLQFGGKLNNMKQQSWWRDQFEKLHVGKEDRMRYRNDFVCALILHSLEWSIVTFAPIIFLTKSVLGIVSIVVLNALVHAKVDDAKANGRVLNLVEDQAIHLIQIAVTAVLWYRCTQC